MDENARLVGLEIIATFAAEDGAVRMPTELVAPRLSVEEQYCLFVEKLALLETCQHFFLFSINLLHGLIYRLQLVTYYY